MNPIIPQHTVAGSDPLKAAQAFVASVEVTLVHLHGSIAGGLVPIELVREQRIRCSAEQLLRCAAVLADSELLVPGSTKQLRPHPLLKEDRDLRREITEALQELIFRATNRSMLDEAKTIILDLDGSEEAIGGDPDGRPDETRESAEVRG